MQEDYIYTSPINNPTTASCYGNTYYAPSPDKAAYVESNEKSAAVNYAETIKSIRQQRQDEYE